RTFCVQLILDRLDLRMLAEDVGLHDVHELIAPSLWLRSLYRSLQIDRLSGGRGVRIYFRRAHMNAWSDQRQPIPLKVQIDRIEQFAFAGHLLWTVREEECAVVS